MKSMIYNEFCMCFNRKNLKVLLLIELYIIAEMYNLYRSITIENINALDVDGILKICGGLYAPFSLFNIIGWLLIISVLIFISSNNISIMNGFDMMVLSRASSKGKWWISKIMSLIIINVFYTLVVIITSKIFSFIIFKPSNKWSIYTSVYYPNVYNSLITPMKLEIIIFFMLLTGFIALTTLFQTVNMIFNNDSKIYVVLIIISLSLAILYTQGLIPRVLSPLNYPSILDIVTIKTSYLKYLSTNIIFIIVNVLVSLMVVTNKDYKISSN